MIPNFEMSSQKSISRYLVGNSPYLKNYLQYGNRATNRAICQKVKTTKDLAEYKYFLAHIRSKPIQRGACHVILPLTGSTAEKTRHASCIIPVAHCHELSAIYACYEAPWRGPDFNCLPDLRSTESCEPQQRSGISALTVCKLYQAIVFSLTT